MVITLARTSFLLIVFHHAKSRKNTCRRRGPAVAFCIRSEPHAVRGQAGGGCEAFLLPHPLRYFLESCLRKMLIEGKRELYLESLHDDK